MLSQIGLFLLDVLLLPFTGIVLLRFHTVWMNVPMRNPVGEFVMAITDFLVLPLRRNLPSLGRFDLASFSAAAALAWSYLLAALWFKGYPFEFFPGMALLLWTALELARLSLYLLMAGLLLQAILSWTNPHSPLQPFLHAVTYRFVRPVQRILPTVGRVDLSPLVVLIACQLLLIVPILPLEQQITNMLR
ncbi:MAG TPA: YggT family protein [Gallionella sp.]